MSDRYAVRYDVEAREEGWTPDELGASGGADALVLISIMFEPDGGRSDLVLSIDGRSGGQLPDIELFKSWVMLAHKLMNSEQITDDGRYLAQRVFEQVQAQVLVGRHRHVQPDA